MAAKVFSKKQGQQRQPAPGVAGRATNVSPPERGQNDSDRGKTRKFKRKYRKTSCST